MSGQGGRGIVPPHVLAAIAENGSPEQRRWARDVLATDARFREVRATEPKAGTSRVQDADDGSGESRGGGGTP